MLSVDFWLLNWFLVWITSVNEVKSINLLILILLSCIDFQWIFGAFLIGIEMTLPVIRTIVLVLLFICLLWFSDLETFWRTFIKKGATRNHDQSAIALDGLLFSRLKSKHYTIRSDDSWRIQIECNLVLLNTYFKKHLYNFCERLHVEN